MQEEGYDMVNRYNTGDSPTRGQKVHSKVGGGQTVQSPRLLALITQLSALMLQVKRIADGERSVAAIIQENWAGWENPQISGEILKNTEKWTSIFAKFTWS